MDSQMEDDLADLYDAAENELIAGYVRADRLVYAFAKHHGLSTTETWRLMAEEASVRGNEAVRHLSENPLTERYDDQRLLELMSQKVTDRVADLVGSAYEAFRDRGPGRGRPL
ncbi:MULTISPECIES: hypothetical protein [unclassified Modestobacter]|uniref:hypothetical protein n=1 Tax=unclassified Modestobacter TaxID=2643866 RepID=UPI0022AA18CA|nr:MULTISPECIES: hypothetical protein [unclassified Modestobacter]MCZ2826045.1 hypothetical protein [Modestobacter sp. VKM Ac-2981]MCZ2852890.1 hypothetical protein [Modestobacter sp. VKM Ac-2982]